MEDKKVKASFYTVAGDYSEIELYPKEVIENFLPDMSPPISTIIIESVFDNKPVFISINSGGIVIRGFKL